MTIPFLILSLSAAGAPPEGPPPVLGVAGSTDEIRRELRAVEDRFREAWGGVTADELTPPRIPDDRNRARVILEAAGRFDELREQSGGTRPVELTGAVGSLRPEIAAAAARRHRADWLRFRTVVDGLAPLDLLDGSRFSRRRGAGRRSFVPLLDLLNTGQLLTLATLVELAGDDTGAGDGTDPDPDGETRGARTRRCREALRGFDRLDAYAGAFAQEPDATLQTIRMAVDRDALGVLREILERCELPAKELVRVSLQLDAPRRRPIELSILDGWLSFLEVLPEIRAAAAPGPTAAGEAPADVADPHRIVLAARLQMLRHVAASLTHATTPPVRRGLRPPTGRGGLPESLEGVGDTPLLAGLSALASPLLDATDGTSIGRDLAANDVWETRFRLARIAVALERWAADHDGTYPAALAELSPRYLVEIPDDPYTGRPPTYERTDRRYRLTVSPRARADWPHDVDPVLEWPRVTGQVPG